MFGPIDSFKSSASATVRTLGGGRPDFHRGAPLPTHSDDAPMLLARLFACHLSSLSLWAECDRELLGACAASRSASMRGACMVVVRGDPVACGRIISGKGCVLKSRPSSISTGRTRPEATALNSARDGSPLPASCAALAEKGLIGTRAAAMGLAEPVRAVSAD